VINHTTVRASWTNPPFQQLKGKVDTYTVTYEIVGRSAVYTFATLPGNETSVMINVLRPSTEYDFRVSSGLSLCSLFYLFTDLFINHIFLFCLSCCYYRFRYTMELVIKKEMQFAPKHWQVVSAEICDERIFMLLLVYSFILFASICLASDAI